MRPLSTSLLSRRPRTTCSLHYRRYSLRISGLRCTSRYRGSLEYFSRAREEFSGQEWDTLSRRVDVISISIIILLHSPHSLFSALSIMIMYSLYSRLFLFSTLCIVRPLYSPLSPLSPLSTLFTLFTLPTHESYTYPRLRATWNRPATTPLSAYIMPF